MEFYMLNKIKRKESTKGIYRRMGGKYFIGHDKSH